MANEPPDAALGHYMTRARAVTPLDRADERVLARKALNGDQVATAKLIEANLRHVVAIALKFRRYRIPLGELIAEGNVGLVIAVQKFDPEQGTRFVTYASYWIRAFVLDLVVKSSRLVGGGSGALRSKVFFRLRRERARLVAARMDREQQVERLASDFGVDPERMRTMLTQLESHDVSLDAAAHSDSDVTRLDLMRDEGVDQEQSLIARQSNESLNDQVASAMGQLDDRERYIVEQHIMGEDQLSLAELGRRLGISRERARQIEARAKRKLRATLEAAAA